MPGYEQAEDAPAAPPDPEVAIREMSGINPDLLGARAGGASVGFPVLDLADLPDRAEVLDRVRQAPPPQAP